MSAFQYPTYLLQKAKIQQPQYSQMHFSKFILRIIVSLEIVYVHPIYKIREIHQNTRNKINCNHITNS